MNEEFKFRINKKLKVSERVTVGSVVSYPFDKHKIKCMIVMIKDGLFRLRPVMFNERIVKNLGADKDVSKSTLNRLSKFLFHTNTL